MVRLVLDYFIFKNLIHFFLINNSDNPGSEERQLKQKKNKKAEEAQDSDNPEPKERQSKQKKNKKAEEAQNKEREDDRISILFLLYCYIHC